MQQRDKVDPAIGDPRLSVANIKSTIVAGLVALARESGVACEPWFAGLRLGPAQFSTDALPSLSYRQAALIIRRALRSLPGSGHGLVLGARQDIGSFGLLGLAMLTAPDFARALRLGIHYAPITGAMVELSLEEDEPGQSGIAVVVRMRDRDRELEPFLCEELFVSSLHLCRGLLGPGFRPRRVELAYPAPAYALDYNGTFDCEVRFGCERNCVLIDAAWLASPMPAHNPASAQQVLALCDAQLRGRQASSEIVAVVERLLRARLADNPRLVDVAAELHMTERTLRRQLQSASTSFTALHDRIRSEAARRLLGESRLTIAQIGTAVGFRDAREFRRAFKRWSGVAPRSLRP
ncbi:AraC family transcriptional regulator [Lysobacter niabensis]|uniref:AraC family transcriptional regulator n=1 Tax=Agrilutibacter niabensis TaxID=380628 RepID=UPI003608C776